MCLGGGGFVRLSMMGPVRFCGSCRAWVRSGRMVQSAAPPSVGGPPMRAAQGRAGLSSVLDGYTQQFGKFLSVFKAALQGHVWA